MDAVPDRTPISFPGWATVLAQTAESAERHKEFFREIIAFLGHCKRVHSPASIELAKQYLELVPSIRADRTRAALR